MMISQTAKLLATSLKKQLAPEKIDGIFRRLPRVNRPKRAEEICVCALQMEMKCYSSMEQWVRSLDACLADAVCQGSRLVCLPEFYAMIPLLCNSIAGMTVKALPPLSADTVGSGRKLYIAPLLEQFSFLMPAYEDVICRFALRYGIWLYGGTGFVWEAGKVYNRGFLATPDGHIAARQDKLHLTEEETAMGVSQGDTMQVIPTEIGNIALSVCMDATYFETFRIAKGMGADYIIVPIGDMAEFDAHFALRGAQMRVNETGLTAIKPALVSAPGFPVTFSGKSGIYFPMDTGLSSVEYSHSGEAGMAISRFSLNHLRNFQSEHFLRKNTAFDGHYCDELIKFAHSRQTKHL